ncbi:N-formylglutamate amidohydrolase [bacterium]|nr:N-formylglutamate amidohydrolase [bacterium]
MRANGALPGQGIYRGGRFAPRRLGGRAELVTLPVILSLPHAGLEVPNLVKNACRLTRQDIIADGDEGAAAIYDLKNEVSQFITTPIARAIVDLNRSPDDRNKDGVVKTHTCWDVPIYDPQPDRAVIDRLLQTYYYPYHQKLSHPKKDIRFGLDCHTMAEFAPPIEDQPGTRRPSICLSNVNGLTFPDKWMERFRDLLLEQFDIFVQINHPFRGGYIIRRHYHERPWLQVEFSRAAFLPNEEKRKRFLSALKLFLNDF